jgi:hypothetical protein
MHGANAKGSDVKVRPTHDLLRGGTSGSSARMQDQYVRGAHWAYVRKDGRGSSMEQTECDPSIHYS